MGLIDSIIGVESGGNPNATNPNSSASGLTTHVRDELGAYARIGKLLFLRCPSAIAGLVVAVVVLAFNGVFLGRLFAHIRQEIVKAFAPAFADFNASTAVQRIGCVVFVLASADHRAPSMVLGGGFLASAYRDRLAVRRVGFLGRLYLVTSAAKRIAGFEVGRGDNSFVAALASAIQAPDCRVAVLPRFGGGFGKNRELSEPNSNVICAGAH